MSRRRPWLWIGPGLGLIALVAFLPLGRSVWDSLHRSDLRLPWLGKSFIGLGNYAAMFSDDRFRGALGNTIFFTVATVSIELVLGLLFALALHGSMRGRAWLRTAAILPWALPTVVAGLLWRFVFDAEFGPLAKLLSRGGAEPVVWLADRWLAWVPVILADVWKTTPFVALLLLAGLQQIPRELYEASELDGAGRWQTLRSVTLPLLAPALAVAVVFRALDAFRVFDLVYVLTGGGPGTATEPLALYTFNTLFQSLQFGYGSALAVVSFLFAALAGLAALAVTRRITS
jgi:ABC-type sugar transport system permease subunit